MSESKKPLFIVGDITATMGAMHILKDFENIQRLLSRHVTGDWGEVGSEDAKANDEAVKHGDRILSSYTVKGEKLWVITEADRSSTMILTPSEY